MRLITCSKAMLSFGLVLIVVCCVPPSEPVSVEHSGDVTYKVGYDFVEQFNQIDVEIMPPSSSYICIEDVVVESLAEDEFVNKGHPGVTDLHGININEHIKVISDKGSRIYISASRYGGQTIEIPYHFCDELFETSDKKKEPRILTVEIGRGP
ncbi:hypothetical protein SAMN02745824_3367 [Parasphingorhabdus marina DSM 22363]|uniref:Lipoprotein n=1 Tax=Parasphingorhabdus marina DSM 22363 TaxID=1123272 RepID=A0A1N6HML5_9SPHN|nr:hypothetical protein [Parasphingorhabdus marina]SIO21098.1 hypothetical protein SAMN02745824_3367 [Parasphingorhabdus marina DSM 22363]